MILGVCDYPEQVSPEEWRDFPARMRAAGLSAVRLAEFAWSRLEPRRGHFDFAWLDAAIGDAAAAGLGVILGTPTAAPPAWLVRERPEILSHDREGRVREFGSRRHADYASEVWWQESARIVEALARRYGEHPALIGWQTDNEHGCHDTARSYSPAARAGFQAWLRARYGEPAALNAAWGAVFWSQTYGDFAEIGLPHRLPYTPNPSHLLDFYRYASERLVAYDRMQAEILRRHSPGRFVTHNGMPFFADFDHHRLAAHLDFVSVDHYPTGVLETSWLDDETKGIYARVGHPDLTGFTHDLYRGLSAAGHWVMEQQCGPTDWAGVNPQPAAGAVRLWTLQAQAHGAQGVVYFRWQAAHAGQELTHGGLLRHDGTPDPGLAEVAGVASELRGAASGLVRARVALLHDYESLWASEVLPGPRAGSPWAQTLLYYSALREFGLDVDVRHPGADLSGYAVVVAPNLILLSGETARHLGRYASAGGQLVLGPRAGFLQPSGQVWPRSPLCPVSGVQARRPDALRPDLSVAVDGDLGAHRSHTWNEALEAMQTGVAVLASYQAGPLMGEAAVSEVNCGEGHVTSLGAWSETLVRAALRRVLVRAGVPMTPLPPGVRVSRCGARTLLTNWGAQPAELSGPAFGHQVLPPLGARVLTLEVGREA